LTEFITARKPDVIIPVPLHRSRLRSRGFNQAVLLGELFSSRLSIPMQLDGLERIRPTEPQIELSAEDRRNNVKGAFAVKRPDRIQGKRILLLDDVMTTGSTVNECAKVLNKAGADAVIVATIARTAK
jgi:ComF family protein